jgi:hypothetical protein
MKRIAIPFFILLVLAAVAWYFVEGRSSGQDDFSIADPSQVWKVHIADRDGKKLLLTRIGGDHWMVNEAHPARQSDITEMLRTLRLMQVRSPVADATHNSVVRAMATENTLVEVFDKRGKRLKAFYMGGPTNDKRGNYMRLEGSKKLYIVHIKGFDGFLHTRFHTSEHDWRDRGIYRFGPGEISAIEVDYLTHPDLSYRLEVHARDSFTVWPVYGMASPRTVDPQRAANYINRFRDIHAETFANDLAAKDSILATRPRISMSVTDTNDVVYIVDIYPKPVSQRTKMQFDYDDNPMEYDTERSYAYVQHTRDFVVIQEFVFGKLLVTYPWFFEVERK